jgi:hypothetical protein
MISATTIDANPAGRSTTKPPGPSPRSVIVSSMNDNSFEDEPFDCAAQSKYSSKADTFVQSSDRNGDFDRIDATIKSVSIPKSIPLQTPRRMAVPKSPLSSNSKATNQSTKQKATSYRLRRMQLAQQRKWKEENIERTVQSKILMKESDDEYSAASNSRRSRQRSRQRSEPRRTIEVGSALLIDDAEGLEISISNHLQKNGFNSSLIPSAGRYDTPYNPNDYDGDNTFNEDRSIAMDTVSSLNSSHYASDDGMSLRGFRSKSLGSKKKGKEEKSTRATAGKPMESPGSYELHPPLYVSSVKKVRKKKNKKPSFHDLDVSFSDEEDKSQRFDEIENMKTLSDDGFDDDLIEQKLLGKIQGNENKSISIMSPFNSSISVINRSANPLDKTEVVSNKEKAFARPQTIGEKENDIPWIRPTYKSIGSRKEALEDVPRERPITPQMFDKVLTTVSPNDEPPSLSNAQSPTTLRRRRLQLYLYSSNNDNNNNNYDTKEEKVADCAGTSDSLSHSRMEEKELHDVTTNKSHLHPTTDLAVENKLDEEDDPRCDLISIKSGRSAQTYATLKTCMTIAPSSPEEMEKMVRRKQRKIFLLHHALTCTHPHATDPDDENYVPCPEVPNCQALCTLVRHVQTCTFTDAGKGQVCAVPGCKEYKKMWNHYRRCVLRTFTGSSAGSKKCRLCGDLWGKGDKENDEESI